jgi:hypothetical protein
MEGSVDTQLEQRVLGYVARNPGSTWEDIADGVGLDSWRDPETYVRVHVGKGRLIRDGLVSCRGSAGLAPRHSLTTAGFERLMELTPSGEAPGVEIVDRGAVV